MWGMTRVIDRLKLVFLGIFAFSCAGVWAYQLMVIAPARECEANGNWWDRDNRVCGVVVDVRTFPRLYPAAPVRTQPAAAAPPAR